MDSTGLQLCACVCVSDDLKSRCFTRAYLGGPADKGKDLLLFSSGLQTLDRFTFDPGISPTAGMSKSVPGWPPFWSLAVTYLLGSFFCDLY